MQFFVDTAEINEIKDLLETGLVDGVTTNPTLIAKSGRDFKKVIAEICELVDGPISAEVISTYAPEMIEEGLKLADIAENVVVKLPLTIDGIKACSALAAKEIAVNVTLCFTPNQALLAAKAGAAYISPFVGRLDDISTDGMRLISDIKEIYDNYPWLETEILVASIRHPIHLQQAAMLGADVATLPPKVIWQLFKHPLTDSGLEAFLNDWKQTGQKI